MADKSLADALGVVDPRPLDQHTEPSVAELLDISDPTEFCKRVLASPEFRRYLFVGIVERSIPPAVMCRVIDTAWGKPTERVEVKDVTSRLEDVTPEQLEARALRLAEMARSIRLAPISDAASSESIH